MQHPLFAIVVFLPVLLFGSTTVESRKWSVVEYWNMVMKNEPIPEAIDELIKPVLHETITRREKFSSQDVEIDTKKIPLSFSHHESSSTAAESKSMQDVGPSNIPSYGPKEAENSRQDVDPNGIAIIYHRPRGASKSVQDVGPGNIPSYGLKETENSRQDVDPNGIAIFYHRPRGASKSVQDVGPGNIPSYGPKEAENSLQDVDPNGIAIFYHRLRGARKSVQDVGPSNIPSYGPTGAKELNLARA